MTIPAIRKKEAHTSFRSPHITMPNGYDERRKNPREFMVVYFSAPGSFLSGMIYFGAGLRAPSAELLEMLSQTSF
jgi:hypothetical protein